MKRPLLVAGIALLSVNLFLGLFSDALLTFFLQGLFGVALIISLLNKKARRNLTLPTVFAVGFAVCLAFSFCESRYYKALTYCDDTHEINATVTEYPEFKKEYGRNYCVAKINTVDGEKVKGKIRISFSETKNGIDSESLTPGNNITFKAHIYKVGQDIPSITRHFKSRGIFIGAYSLKQLKVTEPVLRPIAYYTKGINDYISRRLTHDFGSEVGGFLVSLLNGEKGFLSVELDDSFKAAGVSHIMAVSGFNLSIAAIFLKYLFDKLKKIPLKIRNLFLMLSVFAIMAIANFSGSVKRAGVMMLLYLFADSLSERSDPLNNLGFSAVVLVGFNPYAAYDVSFLLSFCCTLSLLAVALPQWDMISKRFFDKKEPSLVKSFLSACITSLVCSLAIMVFTGPVSIPLFGTISLVSPLTNLLLLPAIPFAMGFCVLHLLFGSIPLISLVTSFLTKITASYILYTVKITASWKYSYLPLNSTSAIYITVVCLVLTAIIIFIITKKAEKIYKKYRDLL